MNLIEIKAGTVFTGKMDHWRDDLFLKLYDGRLVSLSNPNILWKNRNYDFKNFKEVDIEITIL